MTALILEAQTPPKKRRLYKGKPHVAEADVLASVLDYLKYCRVVAWSSRLNTGTFKIDNRWVNFGWVGAPDIIGQLTDGRFLAIECKSSTGKLSDDQARFLDTVSSANGVSIIARSVEDVQRGLGLL